MLPMTEAPNDRRTQRVLNVRLLLVSLVIVGILGPATHFWHEYQVRRIGRALVDRADRLQTEQDWGGAAAYLHRYLQLYPNNGHIRVRLAETYDRSAKSQRHKARAVDLYYRAIGFAPDRPELRGRLSELLLELQRYASAQEQAESLLRHSPHDPVALRVRALAMFQQWRTGGAGSAEQVVEAAQHGLEHDPADILLATTLAEIYRDHLKTPGTDERAQMADAVMDQMVAADPQNAHAYLARYQYRLRYEIDEAASDLQQALKLQPQDPDVLLAVIEDAKHDERYDDARQYSETLIAAAPNDARGYAALGDSHFGQQRHDQAVKAWRRGLTATASLDVALNLRLAGALIQTEKLDDAQEILNALRKSVGRLAQQWSTNDLKLLQSALALLQASWHRARGDLVQAVPHLKQVAVAAPDKEDVRGDITQQFQAWVLLGSTYAELNEWDLAAYAYERAAAHRPSMMHARLEASRAWAAAGQLEAAIRQCEQSLQLDGHTQNVWLILAQLHLQRQLQSPVEDRDWLPVEQALSKAELAIPNAWEVQLVRAEFTLALGGTEAAKQATEFLQSAESQHAEEPRLWQRLALAYEHMNRSADADRALARFERLADDSIDIHIVRANLLTRRENYDEARQVILAARGQATVTQRRALDHALVRLERRTGDIEAVRQRLLELVNSDTSDLEPLRQLAEHALENKHYDDARKWEQRLLDLEGEGGSHWQFYQARRLVAEAKDRDDPRLDRAMELQNIIESGRPSWPAAHVLKAKIAEQQGRVQTAIDAYKTAIRLGENQVTVYRQLIRQLYATKNYTEADQYLARLKKHVPLSRDLSSLAIAVASKRDQLERALELARKSAAGRPDDALARVWLGQMLLLAGQDDEAEAEFRRAVQMGPHDVQTWVALLAYYERTGRREAARDTLAQLEQNIELPGVDRLYVLAQGYQLVGDVSTAERRFREAMHLAPERVDVKLRLADLLVRSDAAQTEQLLRSVLNLSPNNGEARRKLAVVLAIGRGRDKWQEAERLLQYAGSDSSMSSADLRLRATLLARRGWSEDRKKARQLLETLVRMPHNVLPRDRVLLAQLYEAEGKRQAARSQYAALVGRAGANPSHMMRYADFLLRHGDLNSAAAWLDRLERETPASLNVIGLRARWLGAADRTSEIKPLVESFAERHLQLLKSETNQRRDFLLKVANLFAELDHDAAEAWYQNATREYAGAYEHLARFLAKNNRSNEAIDLCVKAVKQDSTPRVATVLAEVLLIGDGDTQKRVEADSLLQSAIRQHANDTGLLYVAANLRLKEGHPDEAIRLLRKVTKLHPNHALAWNNLAATLASQPGHTETALHCVNRAIEVAGQSIPTLLDTKAMILLELGKPREAVGLLQEAIGSPNGSDPRFYLHLSMAYEHTGSIADAREALEQSRSLGLSGAYLTSLEKSRLSNLAERLAETQEGS